MLAKLTANNQVTLPKSVLSGLRGTEYFEVSKDSERIVLTPVRESGADAVRAKLEQMGITEKDMVEAAEWARNTG